MLRHFQHKTLHTRFNYQCGMTHHEKRNILPVPTSETKLCRDACMHDARNQEDRKADTGSIGE